ncbi:hypothetical protein, partial [Pseudomonas helleri]|uniref:hypothetical protein n=1 Tax=Pseudomonas helleri TaxID=1608996 RepID=UPI003F9865AC
TKSQAYNQHKLKTQRINLHKNQKTHMSFSAQAWNHLGNFRLAIIRLQPTTTPLTDSAND